jgi:hypothetical protein
MMRGRTSTDGLAARIAAIAIFALVAGGAGALDWPLPEASVSATFGTTAKGRLVTGVALAASGGLVRSSEEGEIVFTAEEGLSPSGLPMALGSFVIVEHRREMSGVYSHLAPGSVSDYLRSVRSGDILGRVGVSGWTEGEGLCFQIFDRKERRWVNPLLLLPPLDDDSPPVIRSLSLLRDGKAYQLGASARVSQGTYALVLETSDISDAAWTAGPLAPHSVRLSMNGEVVAKAIFDVAGESRGELVFFSSEPRSATAIRGGEGRYILAERLLTRGRVVFEAVVEDAAGNRRSASWTVAVE